MINDHEILQGKPLGPRLTSVELLGNYKLLLTWTNGEKRIFDATKLLNYKVFSALRNETFFNNIKILNGTIAWENDIDYCPDTLYLESTPYFAKKWDILQKKGNSDEKRCWLQKMVSRTKK